MFVSRKKYNTAIAKISEMGDRMKVLREMARTHRGYANNLRADLFAANKRADEAEAKIARMTGGLKRGTVAASDKRMASGG